MYSINFSNAVLLDVVMAYYNSSIVVGEQWRRQPKMSGEEQTDLRRGMTSFLRCDVIFTFCRHLYDVEKK